MAFFIQSRLDKVRSFGCCVLMLLLGATSNGADQSTWEAHLPAGTASAGMREAVPGSTIDGIKEGLIGLVCTAAYAENFIGSIPLYRSDVQEFVIFNIPGRGTGFILETAQAQSAIQGLIGAKAKAQSYHGDKIFSVDLVPQGEGAWALIDNQHLIGGSFAVVKEILDVARGRAANLQSSRPELKQLFDDYRSAPGATFQLLDPASSLFSELIRPFLPEDSGPFLAPLLSIRGMVHVLGKDAQGGTSWTIAIQTTGSQAAAELAKVGRLWKIMNALFAQPGKDEPDHIEIGLDGSIVLFVQKWGREKTQQRAIDGMDAQVESLRRSSDAMTELDRKRAEETKQLQAWLNQPKDKLDQAVECQRNLHTLAVSISMWGVDHPDLLRHIPTFDDLWNGNYVTRSKSTCPSGAGYLLRSPSDEGDWDFPKCLSGLPGHTRREIVARDESRQPSLPPPPPSAEQAALIAKAIKTWTDLATIRSHLVYFYRDNNYFPESTATPSLTMDGLAVEAMVQGEKVLLPTFKKDAKWEKAWNSRFKDQQRTTLFDPYSSGERSAVRYYTFEIPSGPGKKAQKGFVIWSQGPDGDYDLDPSASPDTPEEWFKFKYSPDVSKPAEPIDGDVMIVGEPL